MAKTTSAGESQGDDGAGTPPPRHDIAAPTAVRTTGNDLNALLAELDPDARVAVTRIAPPYAEGWLDDVRVNQGEEDQLLETIRRVYGGGTFRIQLRRVRASGARVFAAGIATVTIAGEPMLRGRRYLPDGTLETPSTPAPAAVAMQAPAPYLGSLASGSPMELLQAVAALLDRNHSATPGAPSPPQPLGDVAQLIRALRPEVQPQQADPFSSLDKTLTMLAKMRTVFASDDTPKGGGSEDDENLFGLGGMEGKFLTMMMAKQAQQPVAAQPPPGQWVWHPEQQQHVWLTPPTSYQPHPNPQPQAQPQPPPPPRPQQPPPQPPQPSTVDEEEEDEYEPYTVEDVLEGIRGLSPTEQMELLSRVGDVLPAEIGEMVAAQAGQLKGVG